MSATAPRRLTHTAAFRAFDDIESAQIDVQGALELFTLLIDHGVFDRAASTPHALERLLTADYRALEQAIAKARKTILNAVPQDDCGGTREPKGKAADGSVPVALAVDNEGGES